MLTCIKRDILDESKFNCIIESIYFENPDILEIYPRDPNWCSKISICKDPFVENGFLIENIKILQTGKIEKYLSRHYYPDIIDHVYLLINSNLIYDNRLKFLRAICGIKIPKDTMRNYDTYNYYFSFKNYNILRVNVCACDYFKDFIIRVDEKDFDYKIEDSCDYNQYIKLAKYIEGKIIS